MKKQSTSLGQKFRNLFAQEMRSDTDSATTLLADEKTSLKNKLAKRMIMGAVAMAISLGASTFATASVPKLSKNQSLGTAKIQNPIVNDVTTDTTVATSCGSYTWAFDGNTYTQSGFYTSTVGAITNVLNLTVQSTYPLRGQIPNPAVFSGGGQSQNVIGSTVRRVQCFYDASNWTGQGVTGPIKITKLDLRAITAVAQSRTYSSVEIHLQQANVDYLTPSTTFANNRTSALGTPNYAGSLTVNAGDSGAFLVQIPLTVPFTYNPNLGDLLVEIVLLSTPSPLSATNIDCGFNAASHKCNTVRSPGSTTALTGTISAFAPILRTAYIPISVSASSCGSYKWNFNGQTYTQSGTYTGVNTCGDTLTLNLTVKPISTSSTTESAIGSYTWNGNTYTTSGTYTWTGTNSVGCDSVATLNLTILSNCTPTSSTETITACNSYAWKGTSYTASGTYTWTGTNAAGCDSVVTLNLTITPQPAQPALACYETASFNTTTCSWDVTGTQPSQPTLACYETASFNTTTCTWDVTGSQPTQPTLACYESANFNTTTCSWDVTGSQPSQPSLACYETATFNTTTCTWDVTGSQPTQPTLACYESANFNTTTCSWDVTGSQPSQPSLACYETATFNTTTCTWDITGSPAAAIVTTTTSCDSYVWSANGTAYTQSGTYNYYANCQDYTLNLTITASTVYYADVDGDGYGNAAATSNSCNGAPSGYVAQAGDCNDNNLSIYPGATEVCGNGIDDNCDGNVDEGTSVTANPITGNLQICSLYAGAKTLTTTSVNGVSTYNWTVPSDMTITSGQGTTTITVYWGNVNLLANGILGDVTVTAMGTTSGCGTLIPAKLPVDIQYTTPVTPPSISGASAICPNESSIYSIALVKRASSYDWTVPTGATITSGTNSNIINVSYANGFTGGNITVGARNVCGLSTPVRSRTVTLNVLPAPTAITGPVDGLCNAPNANYLVNAVNGASSYNWTSPTNSSINGGANSNNISVNFNGSFATGNITVAAVNNCGVGATRSLAVKAAPAIPGTITGPTTACAGSNQSYSISTVQGASNYVWTVPGGAIINSGQGSKNLNINHSTVASANGIITVKSSNACGTSTAKVLSVVTTACPRLGDASVQLQVYPNPASTFINVSFNMELAQQVTISLRDAAGRIVYNEIIDAAAGFNNQQIELSNLAKGVYFVQIQTDSTSENTRFIVD